MQDVDLIADELRFAGVQDIQATDGGLTLRRLPAWTTPQIVAGPELAVGALTVSRIRQLLTEIVATRQGLGDANLHLLDGRELFGEGDVADLPDGLHPNAAGYPTHGRALPRPRLLIHRTLRR